MKGFGRLIGATIGAVVVGGAVAGTTWFVGKVLIEARKLRNEELRDMLTAVSKAVTDITAPSVIEQTEPLTHAQIIEQLRQGKNPNEILYGQSGNGRPPWATPDPVTLGFDDLDELDPDPTNLTQPWDVAAASVLAEPGRLNAIYTDVMPEGEPLADSRAASFAVGENPLEDIGERPAWHDD